MPHITLAVTDKVIQHVNAGNENQRQLAIRDASPDVRARIAEATAKRRVIIPVAGAIELTFGDTGAVWSSHQTAGNQSDDFADLYSLLSRRPGVSVTFAW